MTVAAITWARKKGRYSPAGRWHVRKRSGSSKEEAGTQPKWKEGPRRGMKLRRLYIVSQKWQVNRHRHCRSDVMATVCRNRSTNAGPEVEVTAYYALWLVLPAWQDCVWCVDVVTGSVGRCGSDSDGVEGQAEELTLLCSWQSNYPNKQRSRVLWLPRNETVSVSDGEGFKS